MQRPRGKWEMRSRKANGARVPPWKEKWVQNGPEAPSKDFPHPVECRALDVLIQAGSWKSGAKVMYVLPVNMKDRGWADTSPRTCSEMPGAGLRGRGSGRGRCTLHVCVWVLATRVRE